VPGRGTTVRLLLPRAAEPVPRPPSAYDSVAWQASGTVVVADDEPSVRQVVARNLERAGLTIVEAADGTEALAALKADPGVRLLVLDWTMPGLDGGEVLAALAAEGRSLPVIVMSGYADQAVGAAADARVRAVLRKPFPRGELLEAARRALGVGA
jgi:CheY-like chemotaxis protein